jgi:hypothetical protein
MAILALSGLVMLLLFIVLKLSSSLSREEQTTAHLRIRRDACLKIAEELYAMLEKNVTSMQALLDAEAELAALKAQLAD